jgi:hypothetical protein
MLNNVSWGQYFSGVILIVVLYYIFIALLFYRDEIQSLLQPKISFPGSGQLNYQKADHTVTQKESDEATDGLQQVVSDLRGILEAGKEASKEELLRQFSHRLVNYAGLRLPAFRAAIANYIITQAKEICGVSFSEQELAAEWDALLA